MRRYFHAGLVSGLLLAGNIAYAAQIDESEINHPIGFAQRVDAASGGVAIAGVLGNLTGTEVDDTDYFVFHGMEGDVVTLDIDGGWGGVRSVDTVIAIFGGSNNAMLRMNDDAASIDEGSISRADARIDNFRLPASGYYIVSVSNYPRYFMNGGGVTNPSRFKNGDYKLVVSGVTSQVQQINIEIKPGNDGLAPINPRSNGKIPVALLSSAGFDAMNVDTRSVTFGPTGAEQSLSHCGRNGEDVNGDGRLDLVCHFENQKAGFAKGDLEGIVQGRMKYGTRFEGRGLLKVVPEKRDF